jgi:mRNA interferase HigB
MLKGLMQVIAKRTLREFWSHHPRAEGPLRVWFGITQKAVWTCPADIKRDFGIKVDFVSDNRAIFDIGGNKYRLIVRMAYLHKRTMIKFVGTHEEYDKIDPETV